MIPSACIFVSLTLIDDMVLYGAAPALFGFGALATCTYMKALGMQIPLWYSRQLFRYLTVGVFSFLTIGYLTLRRDWSMNETR
jgi:hypothetical protein